MKSRHEYNFYRSAAGRPRKGAWIEITVTRCPMGAIPVAPVRGRGLKSAVLDDVRLELHVAPARGRGLKLLELGLVLTRTSRPRKGAWIEIGALTIGATAPSSPPQGGVD